MTPKEVIVILQQKLKGFEGQKITPEVITKIHDVIYQTLQELDLSSLDYRITSERDIINIHIIFMPPSQY